MRAYLLLLLLLSRLLWWDLLDKVRIAIRWDWARQAMDREVPLRARKLFAVARLTIGLNLKLDLGNFTLPERILIISNHQSVMDIVAIMAAFRHHAIRFVAKKELERWYPAVSRVLRVQRHALISRHGDFGTAMRRIERLGRTIRPQEGAVIFPEGTRSRDGQVRTFHSGAVRRIHASRALPIVVVAVDGGWRFARIQDLTKMRRGHEFHLKICDVYPSVQKKDELITQLRTAQQTITDVIHAWRGTGIT